MSGLGLAVQLIRQYGHRNFQIVEKVEDVGGTWLVNTYPGCGCDVASHFYSYSFELNPDWSQKFSMQSEIQEYFRGVAEKYRIVPHIKFSSTVETARWHDDGQYWEVLIKDRKTKQTYTQRARVVVSAVGNLSVPRDCEIPGADSYKGHLFHSALWDHSLDWENKDVVVLGNGCSATQFVPVMAEKSRRLTQFARQAQFLSERPNPIYSSAFKAFMRYMPFAMRLYRLKLYSDMERTLLASTSKLAARSAMALQQIMLRTSSAWRLRDTGMPSSRSTRSAASVKSWTLDISNACTETTLSSLQTTVCKRSPRPA